MGRPNVGELTSQGPELEVDEEIKRLTVLNKNSAESIYSLIFTETQSKELINNE